MGTAREEALTEAVQSGLLIDPENLSERDERRIAAALSDEVLLAELAARGYISTRREEAIYTTF